jgi:chemotaxis protein MotA
MIALFKSWRAAAGLAVVLALLVALGVQSWRLRAAVSDARAQMARAESWQAALVALQRGAPPLVCVEFARRTIYPTERPTFEEMDAATKDAKKAA